jgi:hypothetical protein
MSLSVELAATIDTEHFSLLASIGAHLVCSLLPESLSFAAWQE